MDSEGRDPTYRLGSVSSGSRRTVFESASFESNRRSSSRKIKEINDLLLSFPCPLRIFLIRISFPIRRLESNPSSQFHNEDSSKLF